ncbi:unnamed protein product [Vitrella brassicaformis CCMP3155]|uniref:DIX domain-containing protein n=1 Tax=Vitrella brassicaformis (strain CCMP3155) TaxID=1169540 RepID=A0A0G4EMJ1_VITBC|nr:unnamed protein product [Vitrella brassicaformis CCMP3155]|eukprot:CEL98194.1 unnamed protein product [Vitrella brassicaformis CCMP3155]
MSRASEPRSQGQLPTLIHYHLPGDKDDPDHPNAFPILKSPEEIKLKDVKQKFPLPGVYHFRFKYRQESSFVWIDVTNDDSRVPMFNQKVVAKVLRISWHSDKDHPGKKRPDSIIAPKASSFAAPHPSPPPTSHATANTTTIGSHAPQQADTSTGTTGGHRDERSDAGGPSRPANLGPAMSNENLIGLDMGGGGGAGAGSGGNQADMLIFDTAPASGANKASGGVPRTPSPQPSPQPKPTPGKHDDFDMFFGQPHYISTEHNPTHKHKAGGAVSA